MFTYMQQSEFSFYIYLLLDYPTKPPFSLKTQIRVRGTQRASVMTILCPSSLKADEPFQRGAGGCLENCILCGTFQRPDHSIIRYADTRALCVNLNCMLLMPFSLHSSSYQANFTHRPQHHHLRPLRNYPDEFYHSTETVPTQLPTWSTRMGNHRERLYPNNFLV